MVSSDQTKSGPESGAWVDGYNYQNKDKKHYHYKKQESVTFSVQCIIQKKHVILHPVIAAILNILNILHR